MSPIKYRQTEYRGVSIESNEWIYGESMCYKNGICYIRPFNSETYHKVITESIGLFTGMFDCYNKKIYDGDILIHLDETIKDIKPSNIVKQIRYTICVTLNTLKIVTNIYEYNNKKGNLN